jgi:hypothetical protein
MGIDPMTLPTIVELALAAALILGGGWLQFRGHRTDPNHGSQGAVILLIVGLILAIHGLGLLEYRPMGSER